VIAFLEDRRVLYDTNGNVLAYSDNVMGGWTFGYDQLNRLTSATSSWAMEGYTNFSWGYDAFGNRLNQYATGPNNASMQQVSTYNTQNQLTNAGYTYDGAGDVANDNLNQYLYDAEGRICAVQNSTGYMYGYQYDAAGNRIAKGSLTSMSCDITANGFSQTTGFVVDAGGQQLTEVDGSGNWQHTNVYAGGKQIGTYDSQGLHIYLDDPLGTRRAQVSDAGVLESTYQSLPYGDGFQQQAVASYDDPTENHFTGKERDAESGLDYMDARYYGSSMGRFMSPDPVFATVNRLLDPQQWNMYSYGRNNPLSNSDPTGLDFNLTCSGTSSTCQGGLQGQTTTDANGKSSFTATDVDMNDSKDASAGYHDQFGNQYTGSFDQNSGVSFTNTATGDTSSNSRFIDGSDPTAVNGSGSIFTGTQGVFNSNCGGSCEAKGSLNNLPGYGDAVGNAERMIGASLEDKLNFFGGHGKSTSYRTGDGQLTHVVDHAGGQTEIHFEGHPPGRDLVNFVLHQVDAIHDFANHQSSKEPPLP
jgi:RHS repeat-associated protein